MARPQRRRRICREPEYRHFQPDGIADREEVNLTCDEFEIIRLVDHLGLTHEQAAKRMDISRTTATEVYESARKKIAEAIVTGKALTIGGGSYRLCPGDGCDNASKPRTTANSASRLSSGSSSSSAASNRVLPSTVSKTKRHWP